MAEARQGDITLFSALQACGKLKHYSTDEYILREGDRADCLYFIVSGSVVVLAEDEMGEVVLSYLHASDLFGEVPLNEPDGYRSATVRARADTVVSRISFSRFLELASTNHEFWLLIFHQLSRRLRYASSKVRLLSTMSSKQRALHYLHEVSEFPGAKQHEDGIEVRITREELGSIAGCTRETVSRVLQELELEGAIAIRGRGILIRNTVG